MSKVQSKQLQMKLLKALQIVLIPLKSGQVSKLMKTIAIVAVIVLIPLNSGQVSKHSTIIFNDNEKS